MCLFPLREDGRIFSDGDDAGLDRVVFNCYTGSFCGVYTHRGEANNGLHPCLGHDAPYEEPQISNPALNGHLPWGLNEIGSGALPQVKL
jgi:hypothetical protein